MSHGENRNLELASRNLERVKLVAPNVLQAYDLLNHDLLVLSKDAVARLVRTLDPEAAAAATPHVETIAPAPAAKKEAAPKRQGQAGEESRGEEGRETRKEGEGISHGSPSLSNYSPARSSPKRASA